MNAPPVRCQCGERLSSEAVNRMMLARLAMDGMSETVWRFIALVYQGGLPMHHCHTEGIAVPDR